MQEKLEYNRNSFILLFLPLKLPKKLDITQPIASNYLHGTITNYYWLLFGITQKMFC